MSLAMLAHAVDAATAACVHEMNVAMVTVGWPKPIPLNGRALFVYFMLPPNRLTGMVTTTCTHPVLTWYLAETDGDDYDETVAIRLFDDLFAKALLTHGFCWS